jgi:hypothetical protein
MVSNVGEEESRFCFRANLQHTMTLNTASKHRTQQILLLILIGVIVLSLWPDNFPANMIGLIAAITGGFSLLFLRQRLGKRAFITFMLVFILAISAAAINLIVTR